MDTEEEYGEIVLTRHSPMVEKAPERSLISLAALREMKDAYFAAPDVLLVGWYFLDSRPCYYRVTGWNGEHKALIVELDKERPGRVRPDVPGTRS